MPLSLWYSQWSSLTPLSPSKLGHGWGWGWVCVCGDEENREEVAGFCNTPGRTVGRGRLTDSDRVREESTRFW